MNPEVISIHENRAGTFRIALNNTVIRHSIEHEEQAHRVAKILKDSLNNDSVVEVKE